MIERFSNMETTCIHDTKYISQGIEALTSDVDQTPVEAQVSDFRPSFLIEGIPSHSLLSQ